MKGYREVFKPGSGQPRDPGRIFYTVTADDIGKRQIRTTAALIRLGDFLGEIQPFDVGRRLYRVPANDGHSWIWQIENASQMHARLAKEEHDASTQVAHDERADVPARAR